MEQFDKIVSLYNLIFFQILIFYKFNDEISPCYSKSFCYLSFLNPPKNTILFTKIASLIFLYGPLNLNINN